MHRTTLLAGSLAIAVSVAACGPTITNVTLPGGATSKNVFGTKPTNSYTVMFSDALDLVPQSSVKMNDVNVGDVRTVALKDGQAEVTIRVLKSVTVPGNVRGVLAQTSLLGEKYVDLVVPGGQPQRGTLAPGSTISADDTSQEVQVEDVFGALSELLNGGGIQQLQTISVDLAQVLKGRETGIRDLLKQLTTFATSLDQNRTEIVNALSALNKLSVTLNKQRTVIISALQDIAPSLASLNSDRKDLVSLLHGLNQLGTVATSLERKTQADTVNDLRQLQPTLDRLNQAGDSIIGSLQLLVTYPFGDNALKAIFSDYTGLYASVDVDLRNGSTANPLGANGLCGSVPGSVGNQSLCSLLGTIGGALPSLPATSARGQGSSGASPSNASGSGSSGSSGGLVGGLVGGDRK